MSKINILRTKNERGDKIWIAFDESRTLNGNRGESKDDLLFRWGKSVGRFSELTEYTGAMSRSEAAATIAAVQNNF